MAYLLYRLLYADGSRALKTNTRKIPAHGEITTIIIALLLAGTAHCAERLSIPGVVGQDDRQIIQSTDYPWSAIGRVNNTLGPFCTGTLISPRHVLTAAHCLWNRRTDNWLPPCALHFVAGYRAGRYLAHSLILAYEIAGMPPATLKGLPQNPSQDWAVLTLADDLGDVAGFVPVARLDPTLLQHYQQEGGVFLQAGYSRDSAHALSANLPCHITGFAEGGQLAFHACDASFGDSGSPILLQLDGVFHVVAVLTGIDNKTARGVAVTGAAYYPLLHKLLPPPSSPGEKETIKPC